VERHLIGNRDQADDHRAHLAQNRSENQAFEGGCFNHLSRLLGSPDPRLFGALATARWIAWLLAALAVFIVLSSTVSLCFPSLRPEPSWVGVLLLATAAVIMPGLGRAKRHLAAELDSASLRADAAQSSACAYLSWIALAGLLFNAWLGWAWADSVAALGLLPFVVFEAREAFKGNVCGCC
jgi:Cation efflux family